MTPKQAMSILEHISAAYSRFDITEKRVEVWLEHLADMPYEKVMNRLNQHIKEKPFPPAIAEISVSEVPINDFLKQHDKWLQEGAERIENEKRTGKSIPKPPWEQ